MRWDHVDLFVAGTGAYVPPITPAATVIAAGGYAPDEAARTQQVGAAIAPPGQSTTEMAATAGRAALERSGHAPDDVALLLHTWSMHCGVDLANAAADVQNRLAIGSQCYAAELRNGCNAALGGLQLACAYLVACPSAAMSAAVITSGDTWPAPYIDRWQTGSGFVMGDGGGALVASRRSGFARILATASVTDPSLEKLGRGDEPYGPCRHSAAHPIVLRDRARSFWATEMTRDEFWRRHDRGISAAVHAATGDAQVEIADVDHVVYQFLGRELIERELRPIGRDVDDDLWAYGRNIGHMGPGDHLLGLHRLVESGRFKPGNTALLVGGATGFAWTAVVLKAC
ncbi:ketoacyl-ACP synthase III family protein [Actinophytocola sp.]|uniref:ketoacyl-ACP synthase III family protein n=1 Tax=Actinophytocola sp. TaxID=1872138 RepID=UPI002ED14F8C